MGSNVYLTKDAPRFIQGHSVVLAYVVLFLFGGSLVTTVLLRLENNKRIGGHRNKWIEGMTEEEIRMLGDMKYESAILILDETDFPRPGFLYVV
jgi:hypothetical protein